MGKVELHMHSTHVKVLVIHRGYVHKKTSTCKKENMVHMKQSRLNYMSQEKNKLPSAPKRGSLIVREAHKNETS